MERIKLNSKLEFPRYLDMAEYIQPDLQKQKLDEAVKKLKENTSGDVEMTTEEEEDDDDDDDDEMLDEQEDDENNLEPADNTEPPTGDNIYELYSILIHSGDAEHGHYYAYIKVC